MPLMHTHSLRMYAKNLLRLGEIYADARGIALASLGTYMTRDARFFERVESGRVTIRRTERALQWLSDHWPSDSEWPSDIPRPAPSEQKTA